MLTEKIARKPIAIGPYALKPGDVVPDDVGALLPPGRLQTLVDAGWVTERPVTDVDGLAARVAALEEKVAQLEARRGPGRPRKVEE